MARRAVERSWVLGTLTLPKSSPFLLIDVYKRQVRMLVYNADRYLFDVEQHGADAHDAEQHAVRENLGTVHERYAEQMCIRDRKSTMRTAEEQYQKQFNEIRQRWKRDRRRRALGMLITDVYKRQEENSIVNTVKGKFNGTKVTV